MLAFPCLVIGRTCNAIMPFAGSSSRWQLVFHIPSAVLVCICVRGDAIAMRSPICIYLVAQFLSLAADCKVHPTTSACRQIGTKCKDIEWQHPRCQRRSPHDQRQLRRDTASLTLIWVVALERSHFASYLRRQGEVMRWGHLASWCRHALWIQGVLTSDVVTQLGA